MRFFAVFALIALAEMATFFWVESRIGLAWALLLALSTALIGSVLVKRAGISVFGNLRQKLGQGGVPGRELSDGAAVLVAGAFLISPGFITDLLGFLLLLPVVRDLVYRVLSKRVIGRVRVFTAPMTGDRRRSPNQGDIIDVEGYEMTDMTEVEPSSRSLDAGLKDGRPDS
jgi:UPF0716 protein FxsA